MIAKFDFLLLNPCRCQVKLTSESIHNHIHIEVCTEADEGAYAYAYRFLGDGGDSWTYCDWDAGSGDGFSTDQMGLLHVQE